VYSVKIKSILASLMVLALMLFLSAVVLSCNEVPDNSETDKTSGELHDPFSVSMSFVVLQGYTEGFAPGNTYEFELTIRNDTEEQWQSQYRVFLVNQSGIALGLGGNAFNLFSQTNLVRKVYMTRLV